eukprot:TRINITY_DN5219_c0_g1_i11.p1 TRINITY_DN5219_c0_g1~~TRINITY_DN5219_c0_g1_i11.p1  ORF type:complete len:106 (+),score=9.82 TRINITY_DN5219_c0_g1_i11:250-567(+)
MTTGEVVQVGTLYGGQAYIITQTRKGGRLDLFVCPQGVIVNGFNSFSSTEIPSNYTCWCSRYSNSARITTPSERRYSVFYRAYADESKDLDIKVNIVWEGPNLLK